MATEDGRLHELFWQPGPGVNEGVLENFTSRIVGVAAFYTPDGFQHQIVATENRHVHQLFWRPGPGLNHRVLQKFTSDILGVAGYYTPDGYRRVIVATSDGNLIELSWKPREAIDQAQIPHSAKPRRKRARSDLSPAWQWSIRDPVYRSNTTACRSLSPSVDALRIEPLGFEAVFYARYCMQTSENSPSPTLGV